jgi:hypothetical protein
LDKVVEAHGNRTSPGSVTVAEPGMELLFQGWHEFQRRQFAAAAQQFSSALPQRSDNSPSRFDLERVGQLEQQPPPLEWAGEVELTEH